MNERRYSDTQLEAHVRAGDRVFRDVVERIAIEPLDDVPVMHATWVRMTVALLDAGVPFQVLIDYACVVDARRTSAGSA